MSKIDMLENKINQVDNLANEIARKSNKELSIAKHKITCLTIIIVLFAVLGAIVAMYSIHNLKELFYDMEIEETTQEIEIEQEATSENGNAININGNNNNIGD